MCVAARPKFFVAIHVCLALVQKILLMTRLNQRLWADLWATRAVALLGVL
jgi:hypothetical protein